MAEQERLFSRKVNSVLLVVVVAAILLVVGAYTNMSQRQIESYARYAVQQNTRGISNQVDGYISNALSNIQLTANLAAQSLEDGVLENPSQVLEPLQENTPFNFIEYIRGDGMNVTQMGEAFDASDRVYYQQGIQGRTGVWINYHPKYSQEYLLDFYTPLQEDGKNVGVLAGTLGADTDMLPMLTTNFFGEEMIGALCDENGQVISSTFPLEGDTSMEQVLEGYALTEESRQAFRDHIAQRDSGVFDFYSITGRSVACLSVNERTGWFVVQVVPATSFQKVIRNTSGMAYGAIGVVVLFLAMYLLFVVHDSRRIQKMVQEKGEEELAQQVVLSNTDRLTGFCNRRAYEDDLMTYPSVPTEPDYVYVSADVNGLKNVNDTLGHASGDVLLRGAAECMERCLGPYGRLYRIGGDEFVAMIFVDDKRLKFIDRDLTEAVNNWRGDTVQALSISWGFAAHREFPELTVKELAQIADERMYQAKANYYATVGIDHRHRQSAYTALCATYTKILKVDLTKDQYQIVLMDVHEQTADFGFSEQISTWLHNFGTSGLVHPDDLDGYLADTDIERIRGHFRRDKSTLTIFYRRNIGGTWRQAMMELIPTEDYSDESQSVYLYVKGIEK